MWCGPLVTCVVGPTLTLDPPRRHVVPHPHSFVIVCTWTILGVERVAVFKYYFKQTNKKKHFVFYSFDLVLITSCGVDVEQV